MKKLFWILALLTITLTTAPATAADVTLSWVQPADARVAGYYVYVDPVLADLTSDIDATVDDPTVTSTIITGLTDGQTYYFGAVSRDADDNLSAMSDIIMYTVQPAPQVIEIPARPQTLTITFGE